MYLKMYLAGNEKKVWDEIENLKPNSLSDEILKDVNDVCEETMRRVRENILSIYNLLKSRNFDFSKYPDGSSHNFIRGIEEPDEDVETKIAHLESVAGQLPLSLKAFWRIAGSVCLVAYSPGWPEYSDQLCVASINDNIEVVDEWHEFRSECEDHANDPFMVFISPDEDHKDNYDGGLFYNILLPCDTVDARVNNSPSEASFVAYLREAFESKGFPGLECPPEILEGLKLLKI